MKTVPILYNSKPIGILTIDEKCLPPTPNWTISLGYKINNMELNTNTINDYELVEVSIILDNNYLEYLKKYE